MKIELFCADLHTVLPTLPENSIDAVVTDPPYGLAFMGKRWDYELPSIETWKEVLRVLKPGGHLLAFGGPRTYHRMACGVEDAGFEIRDQLQWNFGSGFPKSLDISKAIDKSLGVAGKREIVEEKTGSKPGSHGGSGSYRHGEKRNITLPASAASAAWEGWGTSLKPANEPILLARKPLSEKTVAANVLRWGTGGLNIDGCRIEGGPTHGSGKSQSHNPNTAFGDMKNKRIGVPHIISTQGRFPSNLLLDESAAEMLDEQTGKLHASGNINSGLSNKAGMFGIGNGGYSQTTDYKDSGGASRFFYVAKCSKSERNAGLEGMPRRRCGMMEDDNYAIKTGSGNLRDTRNQNHHPTVKPVKLMRYLCRLITPPNGKILDPFMGSGSTGIAALQEGFRFMGVEREKDYYEIAERRINYCGETDSALPF